MKKSIFISTVFMLGAQIAMAGASNVGLDCKSASGRTKLSASLTGDNPEQQVTLSIDESSINYINQETIDTILMNREYLKDAEELARMDKTLAGTLSVISTVDDIKHQKFSFVVSTTTTVNGDQPVLSFEANAASVKTKKFGHSSTKASFTGTLSKIIDPRTGKPFDKNIVVSCEYDYSL